MKKFFAKKVLKKMSRGGAAMDKAVKREFTEDVKLAGGGMRETKGYEDEITKPVKLAGGGYPMEDVLKKENYPKGKAEGGYIKKDREELKSEVKGMGPEGKAYLRDKFKGKKYEGKLKGKYKGDLDKELYGMKKKGKEYLKDIVGKSKGGWIQGAVKKPGALRAIAKKAKLIKGDQKLSSSDLNKLGVKAKKSGNSLLAKRVSLAKTFAKMRK